MGHWGRIYLSPPLPVTHQQIVCKLEQAPKLPVKGPRERIYQSINKQKDIASEFYIVRNVCIITDVKLKVRVIPRQSQSNMIKVKYEIIIESEGEEIIFIRLCVYKGHLALLYLYLYLQSKL